MTASSGESQHPKPDAPGRGYAMGRERPTPRSTPVLQNAHASGEHCPWCCEHPGWVVAFSRSDGAEEMGPCPNCERGRRIEFGAVGLSQWGGDGFWRGRPTNLTRVCRHDLPRNGRPDEARQWKDMVFKSIQDVDPKPGASAVSEAAMSALSSPSPGQHGTPEAGAGSTSDEAPVSPESASGGAIPVGEDAGASHDCPTSKRVVPWSVEECAYCTSAQPEEITL